MLHLPKSLAAWPSPAFATALKQELEQADAGELPLQAGLASSSHALTAGFEVMFLGADEDANCVHARVGIFYAGIVAGCNCADDPTPVEPQPEYCEIRLSIDKGSAAAVAALC